MDTSDIVKNIAFGNYEIAKNVINHVLLTKTAIALDEKKKEVAKKMYCEECNTVAEETTQLDEVSPPEMEKMTGSKKTKASFEKQYGKRGKEVMYATAWKLAKNKKD
jgi:hypothetical protein